MILAILMADSQIYNALPMLEKSAYLAALSPGNSIISIISNIWFWSEIIVLLFNKRRRALHDYIAGTVIIKAIYVEKIQEKMMELE